jgi:uncharacterized RDD family membrane protein YckC
MINSYYLLINSEKVGPHTQYEIMDMNLDVRTMILSPLADDWQEMLDLPEFDIYLENKGIYTPTKANYASFWWRLLAYFIDYIILLILVAVASSVYYLITAFLGHFNPEDLQDDTLLKLVSIILMIVYHSILEATRLRGGFGKVICKLLVVDVNGQRLGFGKALARNAGKILSSIVLGLGFLNILWDSRCQGWHDQLAKTYVIRRK